MKTQVEGHATTDTYGIYSVLITAELPTDLHCAPSCWDTQKHRSFTHLNSSLFILSQDKEYTDSEWKSVTIQTS